MERWTDMCLGEVGRVVKLLDERTVVVECAGREIQAVLDVVLADGGAVDLGDVVVVSMGFVLASTDESDVVTRTGLFHQAEARR